MVSGKASQVVSTELLQLNIVLKSKESSGMSFVKNLPPGKNIAQAKNAPRFSSNSYFPIKKTSKPKSLLNFIKSVGPAVKALQRLDGILTKGVQKDQ